MKTFFIIVYFISLFIGLRAINVTDNTPLAFGAMLLAITCFAGYFYSFKATKK